GYEGYSVDPFVNVTGNLNPLNAIRRRYSWDGFLPSGWPAVPYIPDPGKLVTVAGGTSTAVDPNLRLGRTDEFLADIEHEIIRDTTVRFTVVRKRTGNALQTYNTAIPYSAYNIPVSFTDPGRDGVAGTADDQKLTAYRFDRS